MMPSFSKDTEMPLVQPVNIPAKQPTALIQWAAKHHGPWKQELPDGRYIELQDVENGRPRLVGTDNLNAAKTVGVYQLWSDNLMCNALDGSGVVLGLFEGQNPYPLHPELSSRVTPFNNSFGTHTTHVAGTLIAQGLRASAKGIASAATIKCYSWNNDYYTLDSMDTNINITNHSYGQRVGWDWNTRGDNRWTWAGDTNISEVEDADFGRYDTISAGWDKALYDNQKVIACRSAGNDRLQGPTTQPVEHWIWNHNTGTYQISNAVRNIDNGDTGYRTVHDAGCSKNCLTIGSVADITTDIDDHTQLQPSSFSNCGPTDDGRIKPDICGNGEELTSCSITPSYTPIYAVLSGTSMASPSVAGGLALVTQRYRQLYPTANPTAPELKALTIQSAKGSSNGPTYRTGWGLFNAQAAVQFINRAYQHQAAFLSSVLSPGAVQQWSIYHRGGDFRATLCWADPAASVQTLNNDASSRLVVDLDLRVTGDSGMLLPWNLNPDVPEQAAFKADNSRDNVERIDAPSLPAGYYTVSISSKNLTAQNSPFSFALAADGVPNPAAALQINITPKMYIGSLATVPVNINTVGSDGSYDLVGNMQNGARLEGLPQGTYTITVSSPHFLTRVLKLNLTSESQTQNIEMMGGDANDDGQTNLFDFVELDKNFGEADPDLNGDSIVNLFDYVMIDSSFGAQADK